MDQQIPFSGQSSFPVEASVMGSDMSTAQLCDCPAVIGESPQSAWSDILRVQRQKAQRQEESREAHRNAGGLEHNKTVIKECLMSCKEKMCTKSATVLDQS